MKKYKGLAGAKGHKMGKAVVKPAQECAVSRSKIEDADEEIRRFKEVQSAYSEELLKLFETTKEELGQDAAEIFKAYRMIANDDYFFQNAFRKVKEERINIDYAIEQEKQKTCAMFAGMEDTYMRERGMDIENVCNELIARLKGIAVGQERFAPETEPFIVVAQDLTPADTVRLDKKYLRGFVTEKGGVTSHAVILAKTLGIPAVVGACGVTDEIENGASLYINGTEGYVVCLIFPKIRYSNFPSRFTIPNAPLIWQIAFMTAKACSVFGSYCFLIVTLSFGRFVSTCSNPIYANRLSRRFFKVIGNVSDLYQAATSVLPSV